MSDAQAPPPPPSNTPPPPSTPPPPQGTAPPPPGGSGGSDNRKLLLVLSYFGPLALIPYFMEQHDTEVKWHSRNGLVLFAAGLLFNIVMGIVLSFLPCIGCIFQVFIVLPIIVLHIYCIVKALNGERVVIPVLSDLTEQF